MKMENNLLKTWKILLGFAAVLFSVVGIVMVTIDTRYLQGIQYLSSAVLFFMALYLLTKRKINIQDKTQFGVGFVFTVVGLSINIGIWALGLMFFLSSLFSKKHK